MKGYYLFFRLLPFFFFAINGHAQLLQIDNNHSLSGFPFNNRILLISDRNNLLYTSDGSSTATSISMVEYDDGLVQLGNKLYFAGLTAANGIELWMTDATAAGTQLAFDIVPGTAGSEPRDFIFYNNKMYFTATTATLGRELYEYGGTGNPVAITDISPGSANSFDLPVYYIHNNILYFSAINTAGTAIYTLQGGSISKLFDIPPGFKMGHYGELGNIVVFTVPSVSTGFMLYKTQGTPATTSMLHSFSGMFNDLFAQFVAFNNKLYFGAADAAFNVELWNTDGTTTSMVKDINPGPNGSIPILANSVILNGKLFFSAQTDDDGDELWSIDGSGAGTQLFTNINTNPGEGATPLLMPVFGGTDGNGSNYFNRSLNYNGYIFFSADDGNNGTELWKTNGTLAGTSMVKDINTGGDGLNGGSYYYTTSGLLFSADDGSSGNEPWISNGLAAGTVPIVNINMSGDGNPEYEFIWNGNMYLSATDGDDATFTDYYRLAGPYTVLPIQLLHFHAQLVNKEVAVSWATSAEWNSVYFDIQRSVDGIQFTNIGRVNAAGNSNTLKQYLWNDASALLQSSSTLFYRLALYDKDGLSGFSKVARINLTKTGIQFTLFPMPATSMLNINYSAPDKPGIIKILNSNGILVFSKKIDRAVNGSTQISISALPAGNYVVQLISGAVKTSQKLVKE